VITADPETYRILLVEDDEVDRRAVHRALRQAGISAEIRDALDVASALDALAAAEPFDCVLLDYNLPGGDGLKVLREARRARLDVPVIMLTGQQDAETVVQLMKNGASDYLFKGGLEPERLAQALRQAVRLFRAEHKAREAELWFRTVQETSPDGFLVLRSVRDEMGELQDFRVEYANPAACRIAGREPEELLNANLLELNPGLREDELFQLYKEVVRTGESRQVETHYVHEGYDLWLRITAVRLGGGLALGLGDISQRKLAEQAREEALAARSRFYAVMSHELRTPINAILGYNDLMLAGVYGPLEGGLAESIQRSQRATRHLLELVNDVLDLSKLEAGKMDVVPEVVNVEELLQELLATIRPLAEERGTELTVSAERCRDPIVTDPRRVRQIVLNLVSNAIKFGDDKPVEVRCAPDDAGGVQLEVVDFGRGIPAEDLPRIFDEFVQLPSAAEGGTGLGLPISKRLAELLGGELHAESTLGAGSVFRLRLPPTHAPQLAEATSTAT
jgi:PAS domain S-box-containing protein